jgi:hypothetical protein
MLGLGVRGPAFVATAMAIGIAVDAIRVRVYFASESAKIFSAWPAIIPGIGVVALSRLAAESLLRRILENLFRRVVSAVLLANLTLHTLTATRTSSMRVRQFSATSTKLPILHNNYLEYHLKLARMLIRTAWQAVVRSPFSAIHPHMTAALRLRTAGRQQHSVVVDVNADPTPYSLKMQETASAVLLILSSH